MLEEFPLELTDADYAANSQIKIEVDYGGRPGFLVKKAEFDVSLAKQGGFPLAFAAIGVLGLIIVIAAVAYVLIGRKNPPQSPPEEAEASEEEQETEALKEAKEIKAAKRKK